MGALRCLVARGLHAADLVLAPTQALLFRARSVLWPVKAEPRGAEGGPCPLFCRR